MGSHKGLLTSVFFCIQEEPPQTFFVKLRLTRTICMKFEKSLDTCPLPELQNVRQNMSIHPFTVVSTAESQGWDTRAVTKPCLET
jgi:hypothetical protein